MECNDGRISDSRGSSTAYLSQWKECVSSVELQTNRSRFRGSAYPQYCLGEPHFFCILDSIVGSDALNRTFPKQLPSFEDLRSSNSLARFAFDQSNFAQQSIYRAIDEAENTIISPSSQYQDSWPIIIYPNAEASLLFGRFTQAQRPIKTRSLFLPCKPGPCGIELAWISSLDSPTISIADRKTTKV